jgi:hypothetical protein
MTEDVPPPTEPEPGWSQSLGRGAAGIALLHVVHARAAVGPWTTANQWIRLMTNEPVIATSTASMFRGAPAVAFVLRAAGQPAYQPALHRLDQHIEQLTRQRVARAYERIDCGEQPALREFDLISGLTGLGGYFIQRSGDSAPLREVLSYLVRLVEPLRHDGQTLPGWWTDHGPDDRPSAQWPGGHANLGMAHGIAGPLALLSTAMRRRIIVPGHADAIARICAWLDRFRAGRDGSGWWPGRLSRAEHHDGLIRQPGPQRPSWCYGTPGIARAVQVAGRALDDPGRQREAENALLGCVGDDRQLAQLRDSSLCHGWAGLTQAVHRASADALDDRLAGHVPRLHGRLRDHGLPGRTGLLEGIAGVRLVNSHITDFAWDACLLLSS